MAVWAAADLVVADDFRDGNVPAKPAPLNYALRAFAGGRDRHHPTVVTNLAWAGACLLPWPRKQAGTVAHMRLTR